MCKRKTNRRAIRPPGGPLDWGELENLRWVAWLRLRFLTAALVIEPEIVAGLSKLYGILTGKPAPDGHYDVEALNQALSGMLARYNLDRGRWIYDWVFDQLRYIRDRQPETRKGKREIVISVSFPAPAEVTPSSLPELNWNPFEHARADMKRAYDDYLDLVESTYRQADYVSVREKRTPEHFVWLAAHQVLGYSISGIADAIGESRQQVQSGIKKLAREIDLILRSPARGRKVSPDEISRRLNQCKDEINQITDRLVSKTPKNRASDSVSTAKKRPRR